MIRSALTEKLIDRKTSGLGFLNLPCLRDRIGARTRDETEPLEQAKGMEKARDRRLQRDVLFLFSLNNFFIILPYPGRKQGLERARSAAI